MLRLSKLLWLMAEDLLRPLLTRIVPLFKPVLSDIVTIPPWLELRLFKDIFMPALCDTVNIPSLLAIILFMGNVSVLFGSNDGDCFIFYLMFWVLDEWLTLSTFLDRDCLTWMLRGECRR